MSGRLIGLILATLAALVAAAGVVAEPLALDTARVFLNPEDPTQSRVGRLRFLGGLELSSPDPTFGGLSGLTLTADGDRMIAVTDRGHWFTARLVERDDGRLVGLAEAALRPMVNQRGRRLSGRWRDAEAVEFGPAGSIFVSFENIHRIWRYRDNDVPDNSTLGGTPGGARPATGGRPPAGAQYGLTTTGLLRRVSVTSIACT